MHPGIGKFKKFKNQILIELRRAQSKNTKYTYPNDIRHLNLK